MATPEIGNQIGENGGSSSSSSSELKRKHYTDETNTTTCVSKNKTSQPITEEFLTTASAVAVLSRSSNKQKIQLQKDDITHTKNTPLAKTAVATRRCSERRGLERRGSQRRD